MGIRRAVLAVLVVASSIVAFGEPAAACSCAPVSIERALTESDGVFLGTYLERDVEVPPGEQSDWNQTGYLFEIDRWLSGDFTDPELVVASGQGGGDCGFEVAVGSYLAVFLHGTEDGVPNSGLCSYVDGDAALAALRGNAVDPDAGPAEFVVSESYGAKQSLWMLDRDGRVAGFVDDLNPGQGWLQSFAVCPGSERLVESWDDRIVVRNTATLEVVEEREAAELQFAATMCMDEGATELIAVTSDDGGGQQIVRLDTGAVLFGPAIWSEVQFSNSLGKAVVTDVVGFGLGIVDLETGAEEQLFFSGGVIDPDNPGEGIPDRMEGFALNAAGDRVALEVTRYRDGEPTRSTVVVADLTTGETVEADLDVEGNYVRWLSDDRLLLTAYDEPSLLLDAGTLAVVDELGESTQAWWTATPVDPNRIWYLDGPRLTSVELGTGEETAIQALAIEQQGQITAMDTAIEITADLPVRDLTDELPGRLPTPADPSTAPAEPDAEQALEPEASAAGAPGLPVDAETSLDEPAGGQSSRWFVGAGVLALLVAYLVLRTRFSASNHRAS